MGQITLVFKLRTDVADRGRRKVFARFVGQRERSEGLTSGDMILNDRREYLPLAVVKPVTASFGHMFLTGGHARRKFEANLTSAPHPVNNNAPQG